MAVSTTDTALEISKPNRAIQIAHAAAGIAAFAGPTVEAWMHLGPYGALSVTIPAVTAGKNFAEGKYVRGLVVAGAVAVGSMLGLGLAKGFIGDPNFPYKEYSDQAREALDKMSWKPGETFKFNYRPNFFAKKDEVFTGTIQVYNQTIAKVPAANENVKSDTCHFAIGTVSVPYYTFWTGSLATQTYSYKSSNRSGPWVAGEQSAPTDPRERACKGPVVGPDLTAG